MIVTQGEAANEQAAEIVKRGGVIAYRTDTFYGLGADPDNAQAVGKIYELKGREDGKPILILISDLSVIADYLSHTTSTFQELASRFWPGPLTLVGAARSELPPELTAGTGTLGLRLPDSKPVCDLVRGCGGALTATSANPSGKPAGISALEVESHFPQIELIIDGGVVTSTEPSTVLQVIGARPQLIREGAIRRVELERWLDA
jgi:L-threonylcarbamoyladenylate synthase